MKITVIQLFRTRSNVSIYVRLYAELSIKSPAIFKKNNWSLSVIGLDQVPVLKDLASKNAVQITAIEYVYSFVIELGLNVIKKSGAFVVILKCRTDFALRVMDAAKSMGMINEWAWILTDMALDEVRNTSDIPNLS